MPLPSFGRSRSNNKAANTARHRNAAQETTQDTADPAAEDHELSSYLAALAPETDLESTGSGRRFGDAQVYQLRLNLVAGQELKDLATERGTSPQALAQEWILERLAWEAQSSSELSRSGQNPRNGLSLQQSPPETSRRPDEPTTEEIHLDPRQWQQPVPGSFL